MIPMIASEQISVLFVKVPLLLLCEIRAEAAFPDLLTRLDKIQLQSGQLILIDVVFPGGGRALFDVSMTVGFCRSAMCFMAATSF